MKDYVILRIDANGDTNVYGPFTKVMAQDCARVLQNKQANSGGTATYELKQLVDPED